MDKAFEIAGDYKNGKNSIPTLENDVTNQTNRQLELSSYMHMQKVHKAESRPDLLQQNNMQQKCNKLERRLMHKDML